MHMYTFLKANERKARAPRYFKSKGRPRACCRWLETAAVAVREIRKFYPDFGRAGFVGNRHDGFEQIEQYDIKVDLPTGALDDEDDDDEDDDDEEAGPGRQTVSVTAVQATAAQLGDRNLIPSSPPSLVHSSDPFEPSNGLTTPTPIIKYEALDTKHPG